MHMVQARMEITVKFNALPEATVTDGRATFTVDASGREVVANVKGKAWRKLLDAEREAPGRWTCAVAGKMGEATPRGFVLLDAGLQVFIKPAKEGEPGVVQPTAAPPTPPRPAPPPPPPPARPTPPQPKPRTLAEAHHAHRPVVEYRRPPSREVADAFRDAAKGRGW